MDKDEELIWTGEPPQRCDICHAVLEDEFYDSKTRRGPWAYMCFDCWLLYGIGLGAGKGQLYRRSGKEFVKLTG